MTLRNTVIVGKLASLQYEQCRGVGCLLQLLWVDKMLNLSSRHVYYTSMIYLEIRLEVSFSWSSKLLSSISTFYSYLNEVYRGDAIFWLLAILYLALFENIHVISVWRGQCYCTHSLHSWTKCPFIKYISGFSINAIEAVEMVHTVSTQGVSFVNYWSFIYFNITALILQIMRYSSSGMEVIHLSARVHLPAA